MVGPRDIQIPALDEAVCKAPPAAAVLLNGDLSGFAYAAAENAYLEIEEHLGNHSRSSEVRRALRVLCEKAYALGQESKDYTK